MKIAIITGGQTGEREISIKSAHNVQSLIDFAETELFVFPEEKESFVDRVKIFDLAIPVIHGAGGEDGTIQKIFKSLNIPFIFSDVYTHEIGIDKIKTKSFVKGLGIISPLETDAYPLFAKPRFGGSSVASKLCNTPEDFSVLVKDNPGIELIKETPIKGCEFTVGVVEYKGRNIVLPVIEIIPKGEFFDFENKYDPDKLATEICPAKIDVKLSEELQKQALLVHTHLKARHISRSDFIVTSSGDIYFLEVNTIPGMTATSLIPKMLTTADISITDLFKYWCTECSN